MLITDEQESLKSMLSALSVILSTPLKWHFAEKCGNLKKVLITFLLAICERIVRLSEK